MKKIAIVGNFVWPHYQQALLDGFKACSDCITPFPIVLKYYPVWNLLGIFINSIILLYYIIKTSPQIVFLYRVDYIFACILPIMKKITGCKLLIYHNDDPYNKDLNRSRKHYYFLRSVKYADIAYVYRDVNINEALALGAKEAKLMRSHYYSKYDKACECPIDFSQKKNEIIFIGHYEPDDRIEYLDALFKAGINIHIYGHDDWFPSFEKYKWPKDHLHPAIYGSEYRKKLSEAYAALAFFSKKNRDDYTRRCFEIPMAGTLLVAPKTKYMEKVFNDGVNVVLFSSPLDLIMKVTEIMSNKYMVKAMTEAGVKFIRDGNFSEIDCAKMVINDINKLFHE